MFTLDDMKPYMSGALSEAVKCGIPDLDNFIRYKRNFTVIGGIGNVGKTTAWMYILFTWATTLNKKFLMFLNENTPAEMAMQVLEWRNRKWITDMSILEAEIGLEWVNKHFMFLPNDYKTGMRDLLTLFYMIKKGSEINRAGAKNSFGKFVYDGVFIDPYNSIPVYTGYTGHYENASNFRSAVNTLDAKVMVSMHANTEAQRRRDPDTGLVKVPHISDLEMGSMWFNRADDAVTIHRQIQSPELNTISEVHVQKIKHKRSGGNPTPHDEPIRLFWRQSLCGRFEYEESGDAVEVEPRLQALNIKY